jgi:acetolactate synthase-1/2/3 large subunit
VCGRDQRARRHQPRDRHRHRDARQRAGGVHHRAGVVTLLGTDAFQETDITGVTLPITKHNYLVTRAEDIARCCARRSTSRGAAGPGPVLVDITKDAQQASCAFDPSDRALARPPGCGRPAAPPPTRWLARPWR